MYDSTNESRRSSHNTGHLKSAKALYNALLDHYGTQHWWPADTDFEMMIGAVLVQHTAWRNVERSIARLKQEQLLTPSAIAQADYDYLMMVIQSSGFMKAKARTCINLSAWLLKHGYSGTEVEPTQDSQLRNDLLSIAGVGSETADVIRLYAFEQPCFIWDVYARRLLATLGYPKYDSYKQARSQEHMFIALEEFSVAELQEFHALIVEHGKATRTQRGWLP